MDPEIPMILPKGIVVNTKEIYHEIAGYQFVPADRVWKIWRGKARDYTCHQILTLWSQSTQQRTKSYKIPQLVDWRTSGGTS